MASSAVNIIKFSLILFYFGSTIDGKIVNRREPNSTVGPKTSTLDPNYRNPECHYSDCDDCLDHLSSNMCRDCCEYSVACWNCRHTDDTPPKLIDPEPDCHVECGTSPALRCKPRIFIILIACIYNLIN